MPRCTKTSFLITPHYICAHRNLDSLHNAAFKGYSLVDRGMADEHLIVVLHQTVLLQLPMLDVSNVDNVCVCDQFALKQGHLSMVPLTRGHLPCKVTLGLLKGWPYKKLTTCIQCTKYIF